MMSTLLRVLTWALLTFVFAALLLAGLSQVGKPATVHMLSLLAVSAAASLALVRRLFTKPEPGPV